MLYAFSTKAATKHIEDYINAMMKEYAKYNKELSHYLKTIMYNLTNNAVKALGGTSGGTITWLAWKEGAQKYLSVTDNGPGATQEAFRALYDDTAPIGIKSGLGLHIVRDPG